MTGADNSVTKSPRGVPQHGGRRVSGAGGGLADDLSAVAAFDTAARRHGAAASRPESGAGCLLLALLGRGTPQNPGAKFSRGCGKKTAWGDA